MIFTEETQKERRHPSAGQRLRYFPPLFWLQIVAKIPQESKRARQLIAIDFASRLGEQIDKLSPFRRAGSLARRRLRQHGRQHVIETHSVPNPSRPATADPVRRRQSLTRRGCARKREVAYVAIWDARVRSKKNRPGASNVSFAA
jgi:hypothetical protein